MNKYYKFVLIPSLLAIAIPTTLSIINDEWFGNMASWGAYIIEGVIVYDVIASYFIKRAKNTKKKEAV